MPLGALVSKFGEKAFKEYVSAGISHPILYDLVYKIRTTKDVANFASSDSKKVKCFDVESITH